MSTWSGYGTAIFERTPSRHGRTRAPQPRRRSRAQLSERRSAISPRRVSRKTAVFGRQSCGTEGTRLLIPDLAATAGQVSASRPMRAHIPSSDRTPRPGCERAARREPAVAHRLRTKRRSAIALRSRGASAHLRRSARERPQPGAAPGCNPPFVTLSIGLDPGGIARSAASDADTARLIMMPLRVGAYALRP